MLTPQEVSEKCFSKATFGGYDMGEVDDFLDSLTEDYTALYKENALLKSKMKLLVEKVEEYRSSEEDMRKAIDAAKSMANQIMEDARRKGACRAVGAVEHERPARKGPFAAGNEKIGIRAPVFQSARPAAGEGGDKGVLVKKLFGARFALFGELIPFGVEHF